MSEGMGARSRDGLAGAEAPEPPSRLGSTSGIPSASVEEVAWALRVHYVGEDAAARSRDCKPPSTGWTYAMREAAALLTQFIIIRKGGPNAG